MKAIKGLACVIISLMSLGFGACCSNSECEAGKCEGSASTEAVIDNILTRRSIRQYTNQAIPRDTLDIILNCGINAPNGRNQQSYEIKVIDNPETTEWLSDNVEGLYKAPVYLFIASDKMYDASLIDIGLLSENICLSAWAYGIGSVNLSGPVRALKEKPEIIEQLGFGENHELSLIVALGYPAEKPDAKPRNKEKIQFVDKIQP